MKNILITGVNGFIGTHCYDYFRKKDCNVYGIDILQSDKPNCKTGSISRDLLTSFNIKFDTIIHLAGSGSVSQAKNNPELEEKKTVESTSILINFIKENCPEAKILYASSAAVYGNDYSVNINEDAAPAPFSVYGMHKLKVEQLLKTASNEDNLNVCILRFFSVYGEGLRKQVLWDFTNRLLDNINEPVINCFGTGTESRDFVHIDDVVKMFDFASTLQSSFEILNCGTGIPRTIKSILSKIAEKLQYKGQLEFEQDLQPGNPLFLVADVTKATKLGYTAEVSFNQGLDNFLKWVLEVRSNGK